MKTQPEDVRAILRLVDQGLSERAIARQLGWSRSTIWNVKQRRAKGLAQLEALKEVARG